MTQDINDSDFQNEVIDSDKPVLVDVWAEWCMPCKTLGPIIDEIAEEYQDQLKVVKIDMDDNSEVAIERQISILPTMLLFKDGEEKDRIIGLTQKKDIVEKVKSFIS